MSYYCEKCGKFVSDGEYFGSGRFCSRACANSRTQTEEMNEKRRQKLSKEKPDYYCLDCGKKLFKKTKHGYCIDCYHKHIPYSESAKQKQREKMLGKPR